MELNWRAIGIAFVTTVFLGLLSGVGIPFTEMALPALSQGLIGLIAGVGAGYIVGGKLTNGAVHGAIGTSVGAILFASLLAVTGIVTLGLLGLGVAGFVVVALLAVMIPGAIGGAVGSFLKERNTREQRAPAT